jgi:hypothetical protein
MAKRWLAEIYQILAVRPLPGQSDLDVQGLVGILRYDP